MNEDLTIYWKTGPFQDDFWDKYDHQYVGDVLDEDIEYLSVQQPNVWYDKESARSLFIEAYHRIGANMPFGVYASASPKIRVPVMLDFQSLPMANEKFPDSKVDSEDIMCWSKRKRSYSPTIDTVFLEKVRFLGIDENKYGKWPGFMERNINTAAENYAREMSNEFIKPEAIKKMFKAGAMWMKNLMAILLLSLVLLTACKKEEPIPVEKENQEKTELNPWIFDYIMLYH